MNTMKHSSRQIEALTGVVRKVLKVAAASTLIAAAWLFSMTAASAQDCDPLNLEPCINGGVSASGLFPSQEIADAAKGTGVKTAELQQVQRGHKQSRK